MADDSAIVPSRLRRLWGDGSGPVVARTYQRLLAVIFVIAFVSLGSQITLLVGQRGLLPAAPALDVMRHKPAGPNLFQVPTLFWLDARDRALRAGAWLGGLLALAAFFGLAPRICLAACTLLYLSYAVVGQTFLLFQWDNLLLECGLLASLLPRDRRSRWIHVLLLLLLFKLYFESGVAKWQSHLGDWQDGSAMTYYYETAPIPTALAWQMHQLPAAYHHFESRATLVLELILPLLFFGPRAARLCAFAIFTGFQLLNASTANYGFFCYLAVALHVFLLDDRDLVCVREWIAARLPAWCKDAGEQNALRPMYHRLFVRMIGRAISGLPEAPRPLRLRWLRALAASLFGLSYLSLSTIGAVAAFGKSPRFDKATRKLRAKVRPFRLVNTYRLFGHITRARIEPEFQTRSNGRWTAHALHYKPGPVKRAPPLVAPHQPRVDFQLWFYGLSYRYGQPRYVRNLLQRLCHEPSVVQPLFVDPLPKAPDAVRIVFWRYHFTSASERRATGALWTRKALARTYPRRCRRISQLDRR